MTDDFPRFTPVPLDLSDDPLPLVRWEDGTIRVCGTGVKLETVIRPFKRGHTPRWIVEAFPSLELADVYDIIAFYLRHRVSVDCYLADLGRHEKAVIAWLETHHMAEVKTARSGPAVSMPRERKRAAPSR